MFFFILFEENREKSRRKKKHFHTHARRVGLISTGPACKHFSRVVRTGRMRETDIEREKKKTTDSIQQAMRENVRDAVVQVHRMFAIFGVLSKAAPIQAVVVGGGVNRGTG